MSIGGVLNRAYHNNKQAIPYDHGTGLQPLGTFAGTYYQMVARIERIVRFSINVSEGTVFLVELEDHPFPPGDPTNSTDPARQNPVGLNEESSSSNPDYVSVAGLPGIAGQQGTKFDGEHAIAALDNAPGLKSDKGLIIVDTINPPNLNEDEIIIEDQGWVYIAPTSFRGDLIMDPARVMSHPSFAQREGEGIYTYPFPPDITRNFIYHPATKLDGTMLRTLSSNVFVVQPQLDEDTVISEIWLGGDRELSTLAEMFRVFYQYWTTVPDAGEVLGWEPRDRTGDRFGVQIVRVQLGGLDYEYREVREQVELNKDGYLDRQLTLQFKLARRTVPPRPQITMEGR